MSTFLNYIDSSKQYNTLNIPNTPVAVHRLDMFKSQVITKPSEYGTTKKATVYNLETANSFELKKACSNTVRLLQKSGKLEEYDYFMMTHRAEAWVKKHEDFINNIFFKAIINHRDKKVFITPIINVVQVDPEKAPLHDEEEEVVVLRPNRRKALLLDEDSP